MRHSWIMGVAAFALSGAAAQDEVEQRFFPTEADWAERFAVDVADGPLSARDIALSAGPTPIGQPEDAARYTVTFKGEIAGFDVGRVFLDIAVSDEAYDLAYEMQQRGIAKFFSDGEAQARAAGTFDTEDPRRGIDGSYYFNHDYESEDDQQLVELYRPKGDARLRLWTAPEYWFYESVPEEMADGATDPLGALITLGFSEAAPGKSPCERVAKVYDGRKRFDLTFRPEGVREIDKGGSGRFEGEAHRCRMSFKKVAGYRPKDRDEMDGDVWVYLAAVPEEVRTKTFAYVPVLVKAKQGIFGAKLEAKFPTITGPDGKVFPLYDED